MNRMGKSVLLIAVLMVVAISVFSQTTQSPKPSFDVISIKPSPPPSPGGGIRSGGGPRGNRYTMSNATLKMLLQQGYQQIQTGGPGQLQIVGTIPNWMDSDRYDIQ